MSQVRAARERSYQQFSLGIHALLVSLGALVLFIAIYFYEQFGDALVVVGSLLVGLPLISYLVVFLSRNTRHEDRTWYERLILRPFITHALGVK